MTTTATKLLTAEEYASLDHLSGPTELIRGVIVELNQPYPRHGEICAELTFLIQSHAKKHRLGRVLINDSGFITERDPDTVRGPDVAFISFQKTPPGPLPEGYLEVVPDIAFEVMSPSDRWSEVLKKVGEFLAAGVAAVCVLNPETETVQIFQDKSAQESGHPLSGDDLVTFPEQLPGFACPAKQFFA
ncbi:MAG: Uma2 family endonuclease [Planctomycetaceae bacterium]|nr:Uma2 family endonuclease [Planctomycetaceae bacterium]